ncbi:MAG: WD40/YVTN/BNR-like repeat-containing protein [Rhodothermales bacterium]
MKTLSIWAYILIPFWLSVSPAWAQTESGSDDELDAEGLSYDELQFQRWKYQVERREIEPPGRHARWATFVHSGTDSPIRFTGSQSGVVLRWENVGLNTSGSMISYAFDPHNSRIIWAGSAGGGLWNTVNGGNTWRPVTDHLPSMSIPAVAVHPRDGQTILIGTGDDFGSGGQIAPQRGTQKRYGVGVLRSSDGGETWRRTSLTEVSEPLNCNALAWDPVSPQNVYLAGSSGVWKSTDAGRHWQQILKGRAKAIVLDKQRPSIVYAGLAASSEEGDQAPGIWKSTDGGTNWTHLNEGLPSADAYPEKCANCMGVSISDGTPEVLFVVIQTTDEDRLYKTTDGGAHWHEVLTTSDLKAITGKNESMWMVSVSPEDTSVVFAGGIRLFRSREGGVPGSWEEVGRLDRFDSLYFPTLNEDKGWQIHVDHLAVGFDPEHPETVYDFSDGGVFMSRNEGDIWTWKNRGLMTLQLYTIGSARTDTSRYGAAAQDQGQLFMDERHLRHWRKWVTGDGMGALFDHTNASILNGTAQYGNHWRFNIPLDRRVLPTPEDRYRTQDGIAGSRPDALVRSTGLWVTPKVMHPVIPHIMYTADTVSVYKTTWEDDTDSGGSVTEVSWRKLAAIDSVSVLAVDHQNPDIIYAYSSKENAPSLWRSTDGGEEQWERLAEASGATWPAPNLSDLEADPDTEGTVYATRAGYGRQVWRSTDRGETWDDITNNLADIGGGIPVNAVAITPDSTVSRKQVYVGTDIGMFMAYDEQDPQKITWQRVQGGLPFVVVTDLYIHPVDRTIRVGTYGRGYWKAKLPR